MKISDRMLLGACFGMPLGLFGMAIGSLFAVIFNEIVGSEINGKKTKGIKRKIK